MGDFEKREYYVDVTPVYREVLGRIMHFDSLFIESHRGIIKVIEIVLCFIALLLVASSQGVYEERNFGLFVAFFGMACSFSLLIAYILMLNTKIHPLCWFIMEGAFYLVMVVLCLSSGVCIAVFCAQYWAIRNPVWQTVPSLAAGTLVVCMCVYLLDLILLLRHWKRYSWNPNRDYGVSPETTVLPS